MSQLEHADPKQDADASTGRRLPLAKLAAVAAVILALVLLGREAGGALQSFSTWVQGQ